MLVKARLIITHFNIIIMQAFIDKVHAMRKAQKKYFRTRNFNSLNEAKALEKEVDQMIGDLQNPQNSLF